MCYEMVQGGVDLNLASIGRGAPGSIRDAVTRPRDSAALETPDNPRANELAVMATQRPPRDARLASFGLTVNWHRSRRLSQPF